MARVDDDPDAVVWDSDLGWLCDVTWVGGGLDGDGPVVCRVASPAQGEGVTEQRPPRPVGLVIVVIPNGDPNDDAIIIGQLHDIDGRTVPSQVNGDTIVETGASSGEVAADVTHILVAPGEDLDQQWRDVRITGDSMIIGVPDADQSLPRGDDLADALEDIIDAIDSFASSLASAAPAPPNAALTVAAVAAVYPSLATAVAQFKSARSDYLSTRIKTD
jgi:hypothetical protein